MILKKLLVVIFAAIFFTSSSAIAEEKKEEAVDLGEIEVTAPRRDQSFTPLNASVVDESKIRYLLPATSDTATLLRDTPGASFYSAGGVSSLPMIHGLADDRLRIKVDGMDLIAACPNHMNSPLSYIDPTNVGNIKVFAGITPVSLGGDSLGGSIVVNSPDPEFARAGQGTLLKGLVGAFYRSNGDAYGGNLSLTFAGEKISLTYRGSTAKSYNYKAGDDFKDSKAASTDKLDHTLPAYEVGSSAYEAQNQQLQLGLCHRNHLIDLKLSYQHIPYEGYPNQRMDMTDNKSLAGNLHYKGQFHWGDLEARLYHEYTRHEMDFGDDKQYWYGFAPGMPMKTEGNNTGFLAKADIPLSEIHLLRLGGEYQRYRLDDWWPPSPSELPPGYTYAGMSPDTFRNINGGKRDRYGVFSEWEADINPQWMTLLGVRYEYVVMDTGEVQGYNSAPSGMYYTGYLLSATEFNDLNRKRTDNNWDVTALTRYTPSTTVSVELGYAHKTRSPNLYERYSWSRNAMALIMNNFVGDGNGYLGNPDLKPEKADTVSVTLDVHTPDRSKWFKATPYYTYVTDYIDAVQWNRTTNQPLDPNVTKEFMILKYMNKTAQIYGIDMSGHVPLAESATFGDFSAEGLLNYTRGRDTDTHEDLYHIMPLNAKLMLVQKLGGFSARPEMQLVGDKRNVCDTRQEVKTPNYTLFNFRTSYEWKCLRVDLGIENIFNKFYSLPQGGAYVGQGSTMGLNGVPWGTQVPGMGRSVYAMLSVKF